jgi:hypothetical protein
MVGLAVLLKPVPWPLLLLFALRRRWRALVAAALVLSGGYLLAMVVVGPATTAHYLTEVVPLVSSAYRADPWNFSLASLAWKVFQGTGSRVIIGLEAPPLLDWPWAARPASVVLPGCVLLWCARAAHTQTGLDAALGIMIAASILVAPISWGHYLVLTALPAAIVIRWLCDHEFPRKQTNASLVVAMLLFLDWGSMVALASGARSAGEATSGSFALAMVSQVPAFAALALVLLVARLGRAGSDLRP